MQWNDYSANFDKQAKMMVNYYSSIVLYGFKDIPLNLKTRMQNIGIKPILFPSQKQQKILEISKLVNNSSALLIFETDKELPKIVELYLRSDKKVFFIGNNPNEKFIPKGFGIVSKAEDAFDALLNITETFFIESQIGKLELRFNAFGLSHLKLADNGDISAKLNKQAQNVQKQLDDYFNGKSKSFDLKVCLKGTEFQRKVWSELTKIPYGHTTSYGELADNVGDKNASRAVGFNVSRNPIWIIIPCHRVLSKEGDLAGYAGGLKLKQALLDLESKQMSLF